VSHEQDLDWRGATQESIVGHMGPWLEPEIGLQDRLDEKADAIGGEIIAELGAALQNIEQALRSAGDFGQSLDSLMPEPGHNVSPRELKSVFEALAEATTLIAKHSRQLEQRIALSRAAIQDLHQELEAARADSLTDDLTGLANRKRFGQVLRMEAFEARESGEPLCLALADVDNFKRLNDRFGHLAGDRALHIVGQMFQRNLKTGAHACRYGGEEFALVLPRTRLDEAIGLANTIRSAVKDRDLVKKTHAMLLGPVTLSMGVAMYQPGEPVDEFVHRADVCLYVAKQLGRDRVEAAAA
jgi:diguanylate cyclase